MCIIGKECQQQSWKVQLDETGLFLRREIPGKKKKYHLVETSLYPYVSQILATVKALLFAFLPIQIKDFHTQVL